MQARRPPPRRAAQQGVVAIVFGLSLLTLIGFAGLVLDGGRLYVNKTELQNAADACALAAAQELDGVLITWSHIRQALDAGRLVVTRNRADFQQSAVRDEDVTIEVSTALELAAWVEATAADSNAEFVAQVAAGVALNNARFARCTVRRSGLQPWFMQVLDATAATMSAQAVATRQAPLLNCALPVLGLCNQVASLVQ